MKKTLLVSTLLACSGLAQAAESPRWDSATVSYQSVDLDGETFSGFGLSAFKLISDDFFATGSYSNTSDDITIYESAKVDLDLDMLSIGFGYRYELTPNTDFFGIVSYEDIELESSYLGNSLSNGDNGYGLEAGVRSMVTADIELKGSIKYINIDGSSETALNVAAVYNFTEQFAASIGYSKSDDLDVLSIAAVYYF